MSVEYTPRFLCDAQGCKAEIKECPEDLNFSFSLMGIKFMLGAIIPEKYIEDRSPHLCEECRAQAAFQLIALVHEKIHPCAEVKDRPAISDKDWGDYLQWKEGGKVAP